MLLVTTDNYHPESDAARDYELVLDVRLRRAATWPAYFAAWRRVREYRPDIVVAELVTDPRWIALAGSAPRVQSVHDDAPKDTTEEQQAYRLAVFDRWARVRQPPSATATMSQGPSPPGVMYA